jgi:hypothetical protein
MADRTINQGEAGVTTTQNPISRATILMLAATVVFIIIASILFAAFLNTPAGTNNTNPAQADSSPSGTDSRAKP